MIGLGTIINTLAILLGGLLGFFFGGFLKERHQETIKKGCGVCVLFIGACGALEGMLTVTNGQISSGKSLLIIGCVALGALFGEIFNIEGGFQRFGAWLKMKTGNAKDKTFIDGFVTTSLTVCIGAMAVVGALEDGLSGDYSILVTKAILDMIMVMIMTCSLGKGCIFSAIPVFVLQGSVTLAAGLVKPLMTAAALSNLSLVGSILIFCVGLNLVWEKTIRAANLLPAIVFAVLAAFLPF